MSINPWSWDERIVTGEKPYKPSTRSLSEIEVLLAASRGNLTRVRQSGKWSYYFNHRRIPKKICIDLQRRGLLEPKPSNGLPGFHDPIDITIKGREAMLRSEIPKR